MGKKKDAEAAETAPAEKITQRVAVQRALDAGKDSPADGVKYVKEQFDITLNNGAFSTIKSQLKKASGTNTSAGKRGRPAGAKAAATAKPSTNGAPNMALQIETIKTLCSSLGVDQVKAIAELFRK
jgi:hypothetical protein